MEDTGSPWLKVIAQLLKLLLKVNSYDRPAEGNALGTTTLSDVLKVWGMETLLLTTNDTLEKESEKLWMINRFYLF